MFCLIGDEDGERCVAVQGGEQDGPRHGVVW
jgi:hypothetical protein